MSASAAHIPGFCICTLGCKVNRAESEHITQELLARGFLSVAPEQADVAILNTCTVTGEADAKTRKAARKLAGSCTGSIIVTGCAAATDAAALSALDERIVCVADKRAVVASVCELAGWQDGSPIAAVSRAEAQLRTRADVKIQDGCDNACSYCIVHTARGPARSLPARDVVSAVEQLAREGTAEVVLVGINLGAYASDGLDLAGLLRRLLAETGIPRLRISSLEPADVTDELLAVIAGAHGRICRHLHICLQSGSDAVLAAMNRPYTAGEFASIVERARSLMPRCAFSTDAIVGFPGETDADFAATCELIEHCGIMRTHVFRFSPRPGTPAAARTEQVASHVKAQRAGELRTLATRLAAADAQARIDTCEDVVVESGQRATSESYHSVVFDTPQTPGSLISTRFAGYDAAQGALIAAIGS